MLMFCNICTIVLLYYFYTISNYNHLLIETKNEKYNSTGIEYQLDHLENNPLTYVLMLLIFTVIGCTVGSFSNFYLFNLIRPNKDERINYCPKLQNFWEETGVIVRTLIIVLIVVGLIISIGFHWGYFIIYCIFLGVTAILGFLTSFVQVAEILVNCFLSIICCRCCQARERL